MGRGGGGGGGAVGSDEESDENAMCLADHAYLTMVESVTKINADERLRRLIEESPHAPDLQVQ